MATFDAGGTTRFPLVVICGLTVARFQGLALGNHILGQFESLDMLLVGIAWGTRTGEAKTKSGQLRNLPDTLD